MTETAPSSANAASPSPAVCPSCGLTDAVQRVSVVIDGGTSSTSGSAVTVTTRNHRTSLDPTFYSSQTVSHLASRLAPPAPPKFPFVRWFFGLWFGGSVVAAVLGVTFGGSDGAGALSYFLAGVLGLWLPAIIVTFIVRVVQNSKYSKLTDEWAKKANLLRSAYYCSRDDVVFKNGKVYRPEALKASIFG